MSGPPHEDNKILRPRSLTDLAQSHTDLPQSHTDLAQSHASRRSGIGVGEWIRGEAERAFWMRQVGWTLGIMESVCMTILVGLSVDYVVHIAHRCDSPPRAPAVNCPRWSPKRGVAAFR